MNMEVLLSGLPHASTEDDVYRGFFIPKGLSVLFILPLNSLLNRLAQKEP